MGTGDGRLWVTYNGEIYNFEALRTELEERGHRFQTRCDTEVLLHGYREWGTALPEHLRGMFAFALVDQQEHRLFAARDRLGKKPFHYWEGRGGLVFGSELKALLQVPEVPRDLDEQAVARFLCLRYVPDPGTVYAGVHKLPPAHALVYEGGRLRTWPYWRLSCAEQDRRPEGVIAEEILGILDEAVRLRLMGDVPLAPFLSGGIDSQAVVESMVRLGTGPVRACTIGFEEGAFDERPAARAAARAMGVALHEGVVGPADLLDQDWFAGTFDEPFGDSSAVPTYHVCRLARENVTVALSGDGGDESFAGYRRYRFDRIENRVRGLLPAILWAGLGALYPKADYLPRFLRMKRTLQNLALEPDEAYARSVSASLPEEVLPLLRPRFRQAAGDPLEPVRAAFRNSDGVDSTARAMAADFATWLPGDILTKVDRTSMAVSLEVRAPFLDHHLVEAAARIPTALKLRGGQTKAFLRRALGGRLLPATLAGQKRGFSVPLRSWMAGPCGAALEQALGRPELGEILDPSTVAALLAEHRAGRRDHGELLWNVLALSRTVGRWLT